MTTQLNRLSVLVNCAKQAHAHVLEQAQQHGQTDLCGWCAKGSVTLFRLLIKAGKTPAIKVWQSGELGHCYIECDGYLLDITASQFGLNAIEVVRLKNLSTPSFWRARKTLMDPFELVTYLRKHKWHPDTIPTL